jgi:murein DD-endopeptidase MepM/ murein hydrolase activator NlpD
VLLAASGAYFTPEIFAIDWIREVNGFYLKGDGGRVTDWLAYGAHVHAVADGTVVTAVNDRPQVPPFTGLANNPTVRKTADFAGNNVVERIAPRRYAIYAHLQPGSVRVKRGQRLRTGQRIGLLGNSGNTSAPHLHFGIYDGPSPATSNSVPFAIKRYTFQGNAGGNTLGRITLTGKPRRERRSEPLIDSVSKFP